MRAIRPVNQTPRERQTKGNKMKTCIIPTTCYDFIPYLEIFTSKMGRLFYHPIFEPQKILPNNKSRLFKISMWPHPLKKEAAKYGFKFTPKKGLVTDKALEISKLVKLFGTKKAFEIYMRDNSMENPT